MMRPAVTRIAIVVVGMATLLLVERALPLVDRRILLTMCDVGQGDALHLRVPPAVDIVIDSGPDDAVLACLGETMARGDHTIEALILTHGDADHSGGAPTLLTRYQVERLYTNGRSAKTALWQRVIRAAETTGTPVQPLAAGTRLTIGPATLDVLWPPEKDNAITEKKTNNASVVLLLTVGNNRVLLTGDIEAPVEAALLQAHALFPIDILKVPHHGSKTSSTAAFLTALRPAIELISVGAKNRYGHPNPDTLARLISFGTIFRTDQQGSIQCRLAPGPVRCAP